MRKNVDWYIGLAAELEREFQQTNILFEKIDNMVRPSWGLPPEFTAVIKDVMAIVDTGPSDAINSGAIALSSTMPIFSLAPFMDNQAEYDRVQKIEDNLHFHFKRSNTRGVGSYMYDTAESSLRYNTICTRVDDLAHILPKDQTKWNTRQRAAWGHGRFIHKAFNPKRVRYRFSDMGLDLVNHVERISITNLINYWSLYEGGESDEARLITQTLTDLREACGLVTDPKGKYKFPLGDVYFDQSYILDHDSLVVWGRLTSGRGEPIQLQTQPIPAQFIFADQENPYGFINWSIRVAGSRLEEKHEYRVNPLLAPLYWSGAWDKLNLAKSIIFSEPIRRARDPRGVSKTTSGEPPRIDHEQGSSIPLKVNEDYTPISPITLDNAALAVVGQMEAAQNRTTGASVIGDTTKISSNTPFSTYSAMVKVAMSRLDKQNEIMADSAGDVACLDLKFVKLTGVPLSAYAMTDKQYRSGTLVKRGRRIDVMPTDFDPYSIEINTKVKPKSVTDQMEQLNMAVILSEKMNMPASQLLEEMGYENVGLMYEMWAREFLAKSAIMGQAKAAQQQPVMELEQKIMQQSQAAAAQAAAPKPPLGAGNGISNTAFGGLGGGDGFNPAMGGESPMDAAPTMNREAISGMTQMQR